jgi:hypothetical protein
MMNDDVCATTDIRAFTGQSARQRRPRAALGPAGTVQVESTVRLPVLVQYNGIGIVIASVVTCSKSKGVPPKPPLLGGGRRPPCLDIQALAVLRQAQRHKPDNITSRPANAV